MQASDPQPGSRSAVAWLALGAALGLAAAAIGLVAPLGSARRLPEDVAATVNGEWIRRGELDRALLALGQERREPLGPDERKHVLERLVEEELLVQRGLELGLMRHDRRVRGDLVAAVIELVVSQAGEQAEPSRAELLEFYQANRDYFARTERLWVERLWVRAGSARSDEAALARARQAEARLRAGEAFAAVDAALGDRQIARLPSALIPAPKLREYLGPALAETAAKLRVGEISEPQPASGGFALLRLVERAPGFVPPFEDVQSTVRAEWRRRAGDTALRRYLDELRERADVRLAESSP